MFNVLRTNSASMKWPIFDFFQVFTPLNMVRFCSNFHQRWYISRKKQCFKIMWKSRIFTGTTITQSLLFYFPCRRLKSKIINPRAEKLQPYGYPNMEKSRPYLFASFREKYDCKLFALFRLFLAGNRAQSQVLGQESKFGIPYCSLAILGQLNVKENWFQRLPVLRLQAPKDILVKF